MLKACCDKFYDIDYRSSFSWVLTFGMDSTTEISEPLPCFDSQNISSSSETFSVTSYEEIQPRPLPIEGGIEHSYISFYDPQKPQYLYDNPILKPQSLIKHISYTVSKYKCILTFTSSFITFVALIFILKVSGVVYVSFVWNDGSLVQEDTSDWSFDSTIPYESEAWFVPANVWGTKLHYTDCATFERIQRVTVTPIQMDNCNCDDIKACEVFLQAYVFNQTVLHYGQLEYEFFFGQDIHVFEGRNWNCIFNPGELRFGYLGDDYEVDKLGKAWSNIYTGIIAYGLNNSLILPSVCFDIDPVKENCPKLNS